MNKIRVLCVDDSAVMRKMLSSLLSEDPQIDVVGTAPDPLVAREKIKALNPDVVTLDVEMPKMNGIMFLERLMRLRPTPVIMVSTLTAKGADAALQALALGAIDVVGKPQGDLSRTFPVLGEELIAKIKVASKARLRPLKKEAPTSAVSVISSRKPSPHSQHSHLIAIGASTGGTEATKEVLERFPSSSPPVVITQHIPASFSGPYAARLNEACALVVTEAQDGQTLQPGHAYVAPGDFHMEVQKHPSGLVLKLSDGDRVNRHRPSVDVLFSSVARAVGKKSRAILMTGMGDDGAQGLLNLHKAGAVTAAQDESTSVVWGMPGAAVRLGAAQAVLPLGEIAEWLLQE